MKKRLALLGIFLLCQLGHIVASVWMLIAILSKSPRAWTIALAYDRVGNAATGGSDKELITERAARGTKEGNRGWCLLCRLLDKVDPNHCEKSAGK